MFVVGTMQIGGTEMHLLSVGTALVKRGWSVSLCSLSGDGPLRPDFEKGGVTVYVPPVTRNTKMSFVVRVTKLVVAASYLLGLLAWRRPKIVHFFLPQAYLTGAPLALLARIPIRVMSRRSLNNYQAGRPFLSRVERQLHGAMSAVLGNSIGVANNLREEGVIEDKIGIIYNGVDLPRFRNSLAKQEVRSALDIDPDAIVYIIVANLISYKGHRDLIESLAIASPQLPCGWRLLVVGRDDGIGAELRALAAERAIDDNIRFLGARTDVGDLLNASDIALSCSHEEGFSNAVIEAMACGLPLIATCVGGNPEAVVNDETGIVVPPRDTKRLADALIRLTNDPRLCARFGKAGKARVHKHFSLETCVDGYEAFYQGMLEGRGVRELRNGGFIRSPAKLKVLIFVRSLEMGGTERQVPLLAQGLAARGHEVTVVQSYPGGVMEAGLAQSNVRLISLGKNGRWDVFRPLYRLRKLLSDGRVDVIYSFLPMQNDIAALLRPVRSRTKLVFGARASGMDMAHYDLLSSLSYRIEPNLAARADAIISNSQKFIQDAVARGFGNKNIVVVRNGIDTEAMKFKASARTQLRASWGIEEDDPLIGIVARLDPMKDHSNFLNAAAEFVRENRKARFLCVGGGASEGYQKILEEKTRFLGIADRVLFLGPRRDVAEIYSALDVVTLSSAFGEGFPNVLGEALACGIPVAATDVGDARTVVGKFGRIVPPHRPDLLSNAWAELLKRRLLDSGFSQAARAHIVENFSVAAMVERTERVLMEICGR